MAAILQPRRTPPVAPRPALRLVTADGGRPVDAPVDLGLTAGHLVAAVAALVLAMVLALAIGNGALASLAPAPAAPAAASSDAVDHVVVQPGDTLWTIARRLQPTGDVRPLVDALATANGTAPLRPGQQLDVPR